MKISVLGCGRWGSFIGWYLVNNGHKVIQWGRKDSPSFTVLKENGKNEYVETSHSLIVVTAPGPGSGKMATCLSQLYHEHLRGVKAGYAKFETFPIWNLPLQLSTGFAPRCFPV